MAIRFVDKEPEDGRARAKAAPRDRTAADRVAEAYPGEAKPSSAVASPPDPVTDGGARASPHAEPEPKPRGRRSATPAAAAATSQPGAAAEPKGDGAGTEGLLPGLQLHPKPSPKPRGRKKAFG